MRIDVSVHEDIARAPTEVAAYATDPTNDTAWIGGIVEARPLSPLPVGPGTRVERVARFMGRRIEYVLEVTELEPDRRLVMRSVKSPFPMKVTYSFDERLGGTRAGVRVEGEVAGAYRLAGPLLSPTVRRNLRGDLRRLKGILETGR